MIIRTRIDNINHSRPWQIRYHAWRIIMSWPMKSTELALDNYLKKNYHTTLKLLCIKLLNNSDTDSDGEFLITTFKNKKYDLIASFITYGNLEIKGCNIIRDAFRWKE